MLLTRLIARSSHLLLEIAAWVILLLAFGAGWQRGGLAGALVAVVAAFLLLALVLGLLIQIFQIRSELEKIRGALLRGDQPPR